MEDDLLGDLNEATLAGLGVNIWYQLPDNYDEDKEYLWFCLPMVLANVLLQLRLRKVKN